MLETVTRKQAAPRLPTPFISNRGRGFVVVAGRGGGFDVLQRANQEYESERNNNGQVFNG